MYIQLENENPMCEHPAHQVNVFRIGVLCTPDSSKFFYQVKRIKYLESSLDNLLKSVHFILAQSGTSIEFRPLSF